MTVTFQMFATVALSPVTYTYCWRGLNQLSCNFNDAVLELTKHSGRDLVARKSRDAQQSSWFCFGASAVSQEMWSLMESWCRVLLGAVIRVIIIIFQSNWSLLEWQLGGSNSSHHVPCMNTGRRRRRGHANRMKGWKKTKRNGTQKREDIKLELNDEWTKHKTTQNSFFWLETMCSVTKHAVKAPLASLAQLKRESLGSHFEFSDIRLD